MSHSKTPGGYLNQPKIKTLLTLLNRGAAALVSSHIPEPLHHSTIKYQQRMETT